MAKPGAAGPPGSHWFYHINRADGRHCWYLSGDGEKVHQPASKTEAHTAPSDATLQRENNENLDALQTPPPPAPRPTVRPAPAPAPMTTAPVAAPKPMASAPAPAAPAAASPLDLGIRRPAPIDFSFRWQNLPKPLDLNAREAAAANNNSVDKNSGDDTSALSTAVDDAMAPPDADADADQAAQRQSPAGQSNSGSVLLAGVLIVASSLLFAGGVVRLLNRPRRRRAGGWLKARRPMRAYFGAATRRKAPQVNPGVPERAAVAAVALRAKGNSRDAAADQTLTNPADDLKGSLQELMGDLERAGAASPSLQSFVPSTYQRPKRPGQTTPSPAGGASDGKQSQPQVMESRPRSLEEELLRHFGGDAMVADNAG